ncbi:hypothetical protein A2U01_0035251, partial [Trifolium medium]|nr:hypothetical protein [Trifolium medium]
MMMNSQKIAGDSFMEFFRLARSDTAICWAVSSALQVAVSILFHRHRHADDHQVLLEHQVPMFSPQYVISGLPKLARPGELKMQEDLRERYYKSSTYMALNLMLYKGISKDHSYPLVGNFPFVGYRAKDREF